MSLNSDLLQKARDLKVNLSATLEQALKDKLKSVEEERWKKENKAAIAAYNEFVAENGCITQTCLSCLVQGTVFRHKHACLV